MTDQRERFEQYHRHQFGYTPFYYAGDYADDVELSRWLIWQAATAAAEADKWAAVRKCAEIVRSLPANRDGMLEAIKAEFPEAFK